MKRRSNKSATGASSKLQSLQLHPHESHPLSPSRDENNSNTSNKNGMPLQNIVSAVYALRRVAEREETLIAVENLISICDLEGEVRISAVKQMMTAGALQILLSVLSRCTEWPEVEMQISKVVSVLVTYEDDCTLLQRSALLILSSLYTLQLKTQTRARSRSEALAAAAINNSLNAPPSFSRERSTGLPPPSGIDGSIVEALSSLSLSDLQSNKDTSSERLSISTTPQILVEPNQSVEQQQTQDTRALLSAAVAKLSLVLSSEWSKQDLPFGEFPIPAGSSNMTIQNSFQHGIDRVEKMRSLLTRHSKNIARPSLTEGSNMDSNRVLQVLLNLILTISEASLSTLESYETESLYSLSRTPNANLKFSSNNPSSLSLSVHSQDSNVFSNNPSNLPKPIGFEAEISENTSTQTYARIDAFLFTTFGVHFSTLLTHSLVPVKPKLVDNSAVLCSQALLNLAEVVACRPGLVAGGALRVIKSWLEIGMNILKYGHLIFVEFADQILNIQQFQEFFMYLFGPVYELIANATAALMLLAGGTSENNKSHTSGAYFTPSHPLQSGGWPGLYYWMD